MVFGPCIDQLEVFSDGYLLDQRNSFGDEDDIDRVNRELTEESKLELNRILGRINLDELEDGYGDSCLSYVDGSDLYIDFYADEQPVREVRVSYFDELPEERLNPQPKPTLLNRSLEHLINHLSCNHILRAGSAPEIFQ